MRRRSHKFLVFLLVAIAICFILRGLATQDPDFGWHLRVGELIAEKGIPQTDPYSYTMPSYPFVDHEWLADVVLARTYNTFGIWPLIVGFALLGVSALMLLLRGVEKKWASIPLFLVAGTLFEFIGIRMQIITWVFLAFLMGVLLHKDLWKKWRFILPLVFLVWANLHGGFAIGIVVLGIFVVGRSIEKRQVIASDFLVFFFSLVATLLNPYGYQLWIEVTKSLTDTSLRSEIQEWYPAIYFTNISFWVYVMFSVFLLLRYWRRFSPTVLVIYFLLLISGLASMRNLPLFVIASFYLTVQGISYLAEEAGKHKYGLERFKKAYTGFLIVSLCLFLPQLAAFFYGVSIHEKGKSPYPQTAVTYLKNHIPTGQIFAPYDWGGYLIWQLPEKKVFIDGRMPSWRYENAPNNESKYAFGDYKKVLTKKVTFASVADKYGIDTVLIPTNELEKENIKILGIDIEKNNLLKKFFSAEMSFSYLVPQLKQLGWNEVYRDDTVTIFRKRE